MKSVLLFLYRSDDISASLLGSSLFDIGTVGVTYTVVAHDQHENVT